MNPEFIDQLFPIEQQRNYGSILMERFGLTRCRAKYFVRLWVYLLLKQQEQEKEFKQYFNKPLTKLQIPKGFVPCTLREADAVFYSNSERGSERAAGIMLNQLAALGLIEKKFDGNNICLQVLLQSTLTDEQSAEAIPLKVDFFDPETDTIPVANFLAENYKWMNSKTVAPYKIAKILPQWAEQYPKGMRVLRRPDNYHPVGFYAFYPVAKESEKNFFLPPSKSLHLSSASEIDPITMALPGDQSCISVFVRSWMIDAPYKDRVNVCKFLEDAKTTLRQMQADFPKICNLYALIIHPKYEPLTQALRFQKIRQDPQIPVYWVYTPIKNYLALDIEEAISAEIPRFATA
jgi:hypothetical protein